MSNQFAYSLPRNGVDGFNVFLIVKKRDNTRFFCSRGVEPSQMYITGLSIQIIFLPQFCWFLLCDIDSKGSVCLCN